MGLSIYIYIYTLDMENDFTLTFLDVLVRRTSLSFRKTAMSLRYIVNPHLRVIIPKPKQFCIVWNEQQQA